MHGINDGGKLFCNRNISEFEEFSDPLPDSLQAI
jgi:hypothetical protein